MYYVYVIQSIPTGKLYKGFTQNLNQRLKEHNLGKSKYTKAFIPWKIVYVETVESRDQARKREKYFKTAAGRRFIKNKLQSN